MSLKLPPAKAALAMKTPSDLIFFLGEKEASVEGSNHSLQLLIDQSRKSVLGVKIRYCSHC
jgi:hypothetical protein